MGGDAFVSTVNEIPIQQDISRSKHNSLSMWSSSSPSNSLDLALQHHDYALRPCTAGRVQTFPPTRTIIVGSSLPSWIFVRHELSLNIQGVWVQDNSHLHLLQRFIPNDCKVWVQETPPDVTTWPCSTILVDGGWNQAINQLMTQTRASVCIITRGLR